MREYLTGERSCRVREYLYCREKLQVRGVPVPKREAAGCGEYLIGERNCRVRGVPYWREKLLAFGGILGF